MSQLHGNQIKDNSIKIGGAKNKLNPDGKFDMGTHGIQSDFVPELDADLVNLKYIQDNILLGSTQGGITVLDEGGTTEGVDKFSGMTTLNFRGETVLVKQGATGNTVDIFIPPPDYADFFNTGTTVVSDYTTITRNVSEPTSEGTPFYIGGWSAGDNVATVYSGNLGSSTNMTYTTPSEFNCVDDATTFTVEVQGVNATTSNSVTLDSNKSDTTNNITIQVSSFQADTDRYKCIVTVTVNITAIFPNSGRFDIVLTHDNGSEGTFTKTQSNIFYDSNANAAAINGTVAISESTPVISQNSGIYFYDDNSQFQIVVSDIDYINQDTYPTDYQIRARGEEYNLPTITAIENGLTGWTGNYNDLNLSYTKSDWTITTNNFFTISTTANVRSNIKDYTVGSDINSSNAAVIIDTYVSGASRIYEDFDRETRRLESDLATAWESTASLVTADGGNGLQVIGSRLVYPLDLDFGTFSPSAASQPDYTQASIGSGDKVYYTEFHSSNVAITSSNGIFTFDTSITESDISNGYFKIEISPDGSGWLDLTTAYAGGGLDDGDGCRVSGLTLDSDSQMEFTLGDGTGTLPGFTDTLYIRLTFTSALRASTYASADYIDTLSISGGNWAS